MRFGMTEPRRHGGHGEELRDDLIQRRFSVSPWSILLGTCATSVLLVAALFTTVAGNVVANDKPDPPKADAISQRMAKFIDEDEVSGAVSLVATKDRIIHFDARGLADIESKRPMNAETIFWIASMTKPVTAVAVLMLQDEGKLSVDDPVEKYISEFAEMKTADGKPAKITVRHLLTHTSGMSEITGDEARGATTLADAVALYVRKPVNFEPGSKWAYCQSSINTAGRIVEIVSGKSLPDYFEERLFAPLGMKDTTFYLSDEQTKRLATSYTRTQSGTLEESPNWILLGKSATSRDHFPAANGGLFSTANDYLRFCQMLLSGGELDRRTYLKAESVKYMSSVLTGDLMTGFTGGNAWGLGVCLVRQPQGVTASLSPGSYGHGGAFGTQAWIDPMKGAIYILMVQRANFPNADNSELRKALQDEGSKALSARVSR
jgi:CubicO group peptidase (beta-lactamase class C family)